ncbi:MAG: translation initiation factor IF-2 subunit alpha [Sulfolobaceae archaeon]|nr:translation initiation factor IF-2 subunit alpha [Sulfolobaceae archaeon]
MIYNKRNIPDHDELVIATVKQVFDYGAYVTLDEFGNIQAFLPWSEVSSKWVKNIKDVLKEGRKIVVKVIRIDRSKGTIDVSLKKVNEDERRKKLAMWKRLQKADKILELVAQKLSKKEQEAWQVVGWPLMDKYGDILGALEKATKEGEKVLIDAGVPKEWIKPLIEETSKHMEEKRVKVSKVVMLRSKDSLGVEKIKKVFEEIAEISRAYEDEIINLKIYTIGAPRYRIDLIGTDGKELSKIMDELIGKMREISKEEDVEFNLFSGS